MKEAKSSGGSKLRFIEIIGLILTIFSIWYSYYLSESASLEVNQTIDTANNRLNIMVKNKAIFKETGNISFFRLEISDSKPFMITKSLKPDENFSYSLSINITGKNITIPPLKEKYPILVGCQFPYSKLYYATEEASISYKITCDNCFSQGIVRRIPDFQIVIFNFTLNPVNKTCHGSLPIYSWTNFRIEDIS
ncbi:MAG: hypothetical protein WA139_02640 [Candidatus Aenigmatarchaeota archaeon]